MRLTPIELALVAELNLEMARAEDEAHGTAGSPQARRAARELAVQYRERARILHQEALRRSGQPTVSAAPLVPYTGPERRKRERRSGDRRAGGPLAREALHGIERRANPDRRQGDRRRHDLALLAAISSQST